MTMAPTTRLLALALLVAPRLVVAQARPVHFKLAVYAGARAGSRAVLTARIDRPWHMYALTQPAGGPVPLAVEVRAPFRLVGRITAPAPHIEFDRANGIPLEEYDDSATFVLPLAAPTAARVPLHLSVRYQVCDGRVCLRPTTVDVATTNPVILAR